MRSAANFAIVTSAVPLLLVGCHRSPPPVQSAAPVPSINRDSIDRANAVRDSISRAEAARRIAAARADSIRRAGEARVAELTAARAALTQAIHFDFDRSDILTSDRSVLDRKASVLSSNAPLRIRIEGNTDERGSDEYNLALGMRRAGAAKRYLTEHGVDGSRVETVSYGEERPMCQGHDEACWSQNRRAEFVVTAGDIARIIPEQ